MTNFISNAIKYNRAGGEVSIVLNTASGNQLITSVSDNGFGIPEDQEEKMFGKFFRVESADHSSVEGTGLGLYVTKQFVEGMGGKLWFESEQNVGSSFHFSLSLAENKILSEDLLQK